MELPPTTGAVIRRLAKKIHANLPRNTIDLEDLISEGWIGALQAAYKFNLDCGVTFNQFSATRVEGQIRDWLRNQDHLTRTQRSSVKKELNEGREIQPYLASPVRFDGLIECSVADSSKSSVAVFESQHTLRRLFKRAELNKRTSRILRDHFLRGKPQQELALKYGVGPNRISQIIQSGIKKLHTASIPRSRVYRRDRTSHPVIVLTCGLCRITFTYHLEMRYGRVRRRYTPKFCSSACARSATATHTKTGNRELLRRLYWDCEMTRDEVAAEIGCAPSAVSRAMKKFKIPTRSCGWTKGRKRGPVR